MSSIALPTDVVIDSLPGVFYLFNQKGKFLLWNKNFERVSGYSAEEIKKMRPDDFFVEEEKEYLNKQIAIAFVKGSAIAEANFLTKEGKKIAYHFTGVLTEINNRCYLTGMGIDISERKKTEEELCVSEQNYKELFNHSPLPQWILDIDSFRILRVNKSAVKHYGYSEKQFLEMSVLQILTKEESERIKTDKTSFRITKEPFFSKWKQQKKNGEILIAEVTSVRVIYNDAPAVLCIMNDTTEKIKLQNELTSSVIKAQERERAQIGQELHDNVNQILTTVKLYSEMILSKPEVDQGLLKKSMKYLQECIDEIRALSKRLSAPTLGKISLQDSLLELVHSLNLTNKVHIEFRSRDLSSLKASEELHLAIYRIVQEQLNNILKHAQALNVFVQLSYTAGKKCLQLVIKDDGKGFDLKSKRRGVGLSNIKSRTENMKGKMKIYSSPGKGCKLTVNFSLA
jgi:PAS domain S-box-containing protein